MTDTAKRLGYGGSAAIGPTGGLRQLLINSGNFDIAVSPSYINPLDIPPTMSSRSRVLHADGINAYSGTVAFDVTQNFMGLLSTSSLFKRRYMFDVGIHDGQSAQLMPNCYLNTISVSGAAGGLLNCTISFTSAYPAAASVIVPDLYIGFSGANIPLGYWHSGNINVRDWNLTMNQEVNPVYLNSSTMDPRYLKVGLVSYSLQVTTYEQLYSYSSIQIYTSTFSLTGVTTNSGFSFGGVSELGGYMHTFETAANSNSGAVIIS